MPDPLLAHLVHFRTVAADLAEGGQQDLAGRILAVADLARAALTGRTAWHSPSSAPWPKEIAAAMVALGGAPPEDINAPDLAEQLRAQVGGAAYLDTWEAGSIGQWGTGPDPLTPEQADAIAALMAAGEDLGDDFDEGF